MEYARYSRQVQKRKDGVEDCPRVKECREKLAADPKDQGRMLDLALALKTQWRYYEASLVFSQMLMQDPFQCRVLCHRAHVYIGIREYEMAAADLEMALRLEPEDWDSLYHLGLCYYLLHDYETALKYYARCYAVSKTEEDLTAVTDWYWMTLCRLGRKEEADRLLEPVREDWEYGENEIYFTRLLVYKGIRNADEVIRCARTQGAHEFSTYCYGIAIYMRYVLGKEEEASALLHDIAGRTDSNWGSFALMAAQEEVC